MDKAMEQLQDEMKVLKNEIKVTLVDLRDYLLTHVENPFPVEINRQGREPQGNGRQRAAIESDPQPSPSQNPPVTSRVGNITAVPANAEPDQPATIRGAPPETWMAQGPPAGPQAETQRSAGYAPQPQAERSRFPDIQELLRPVWEQPPATQGTPPASAQETPPFRPASEHHKEEPVGATVSLEAALHQPEAHGGAVDLLTVATLAPWVEEGIARVGRERLESIVGLYSSLGGLSAQLKEVLLVLISFEHDNGERGQVPLRECLRVLAELDDLLWRSRSDRARAVLLSVLLKGTESCHR
ncbi:MAG: hypothetical protein HW388_332 [Dehalococcoidia bacterium]|nr:hypothetical protein [Dehalococcoidia bacterium]